VYIRATETAGGDGVTSLQASSVEAGLKIASGRINLKNVLGSQLLPLSLPVTVQLFNGTDWITSTTDNTMTFNSALSPAGNVSPTWVTGSTNCVSVKNPGTVAVVSGVRTLSLLATAACGYNVTLTGTPTYLPITPSVGARATFGLFKSPLLYRRENY
jgi:hypothetical protein